MKPICFNYSIYYKRNILILIKFFTYLNNRLLATLSNNISVIQILILVYFESFYYYTQKVVFQSCYNGLVASLIYRQYISLLLWKRYKSWGKSVSEGSLRKCGKAVKQSSHRYWAWIFQQDFSPANKQKITSQWLKSNILEFIATDDWSSGSADLTSLYNSLWLESLKKCVVRAASSIPIGTVRAAIDPWSRVLNRLRAYVKSEDDHFE